MLPEMVLTGCFAERSKESPAETEGVLVRPEVWLSSLLPLRR